MRERSMWEYMKKHTKTIKKKRNLPLRKSIGSQSDDAHAMPIVIEDHSEPIKKLNISNLNFKGEGITVNGLDNIFDVVNIDDEKFTMLEAKYHRDISDLQEQVANLTERLDSLDYYEELPEAA